MKTHGKCTPHAQWDYRPQMTGYATLADPHQASGPRFAKSKRTIGSGTTRRVMTSVVRFIKEAEVVV